MIIYKDLITDDEMVSDSFDPKSVDDAVYEVDCAMIAVGGESFVVEDLKFAPGSLQSLCILRDRHKRAQRMAGSWDSSRLALAQNTGANASAEEAEEGADDKQQQVNNVVHTFRLVNTSFDKKSYLTHLKAYMKAVKEAKKSKGASEEEIKAFEKGAAEYAKKIVKNFGDYDFYTGESMNPDGMVALLNFREDGTTPFFTFWKGGLSEIKV